MSDRIDHTTMARESLRSAIYLAEAHVHATLALVEQQRIANLIALAALAGKPLQEGIYDEGAVVASEGLHGLIEYVQTSPDDEHPALRTEIATALGIRSYR